MSYEAFEGRAKLPMKYANYCSFVENLSFLCWCIREWPLLLAAAGGIWTVAIQIDK